MGWDWLGIARAVDVVSGAGSVKAARGRRTRYFLREVFVVVAVTGCASIAGATPQDAAKDACAPVRAAYQKMLKESTSSNAKNAGTVNVSAAYDAITSEPGHKETCKYLRDETLSGESVNVYSDAFASKSGTTDGTVWISKKDGWTLKQEVDVDLGAQGKGHQSVVFEYPKK
jgi:hypothetical protein